MAGVAQSTPLTQQRPISCSSNHHHHLSSAKPQTVGLRLVCGWVCSVYRKPFGSLNHSTGRRGSAFFYGCSATSISSSNNNEECNTGNDYNQGSCLDWDWNRWNRHFSEVEQAESFASVLKFQLEDAIEREDFDEAAKLKKTIEEVASKDTVSEIMVQLKNDIQEERYPDASRLCRCTGSGLVGWWVGYSKDSDDPFGRLIHITPRTGRFVGRTFSPRQLVTGSPGTPIFEIYVVKDADVTYHMQAVYLHRVKGNTVKSHSTVPAKTPNKSKAENASSDEGGISKTDPNGQKAINIEEATEEGIKTVINFLREKIPGLKVKIMNVDITEEAKDNDSINHLSKEENNQMDTGDDMEDDVVNLDEIQPEGVTLEGGDDTMEETKNLDMKLFIGGVVHNNEDSSTKDELMRLPAEIQDMDNDSFALHIPETNAVLNKEENKVSRVKVAAIAAQGASELMPPDVAKAFWSSDKVNSKFSKNVREIVKLAVNQAQKRSSLSELTSFSRITTSRGDLDPFDGLYVGAFGPYGNEVVQLRRRFGHWDADTEDRSSDVEFYEYVEAVKLTGDLNVPAGQVIFRAKIGKQNRISNRGMYPDELGVVASYKGQGRMAKVGFRNPKWVDGELLQLNGKGIGPHMKGADLGFLYFNAEQSFLVLVNRIKLPE